MYENESDVSVRSEVDGIERRGAQPFVIRVSSAQQHMENFVIMVWLVKTRYSGYTHFKMLFFCEEEKSRLND